MSGGPPRPLALALAVALSACGGPAPGEPTLTVFAAAALGPPLRALHEARAELGLPPIAVELAPSLQAVRKLTELGRVPDLLLTADISLFDSLVVPTHAAGYVVFGTNALVLAHRPGRGPPPATDWVSWLLTPGLRVGRADPRIDPSGYRALLAVELAARLAGDPTLAERLRAAMPDRYVRHAEADLSALVTAGELDCVWTYRNLARAHGLAWVELPLEVNLEAPELAEWYSAVAIELPGPPRALRVRGAPILFGAAVPARAAHRAAALRWLEVLTSPDGRARLAASGFTPLPDPLMVGRP